MSTTPKRQARGERRIEELLTAAEAVFAQSGFERSTTNAIAAHAQVSPGTLYQFFKSKGEMAEALANRYASQLEVAQQQALSGDRTTWSDVELISRLVDPFLDFRSRTPAFDALFAGGAVSLELQSHVESMKRVFDETIVAIIAERLPALSRAEVRLKAAFALAVFEGTVTLTAKGSPAEKKKAQRELKLLLRRYLFGKDD